MAALRFSSRIINYHHHNLLYNNYHYRSISTTVHLQSSWMDKVKNVFTGQKSEGAPPDASQFTLLSKFIFSFQFILIAFSYFLPILPSDFADEMKKARKVGAFKEYIVGRSSEVTFSTAIEKYEGIIRYLAAFDYTGEVRLNLNYYY